MAPGPVLPCAPVLAPSLPCPTDGASTQLVRHPSRPLPRAPRLPRAALAGPVLSAAAGAEVLGQGCLPLCFPAAGGGTWGTQGTSPPAQDPASGDSALTRLPPQYLELRFNKTVRVFGTVTFIFQMVSGAGGCVGSPRGRARLQHCSPRRSSTWGWCSTRPRWPSTQVRGDGSRGGAMREAPSCMGELPCVPPHTLVNGLCRFQ